MVIRAAVTIHGLLEEQAAQETTVLPQQDTKAMVALAALVIYGLQIALTTEGAVVAELTPQEAAVQVVRVAELMEQLRQIH
jgi:hypothetical protein